MRYTELETEYEVDDISFQSLFKSWDMDETRLVIWGHNSYDGRPGIQIRSRKTFQLLKVQQFIILLQGHTFIIKYIFRDSTILLNMCN